MLTLSRRHFLRTTALLAAAAATRTHAATARGKIRVGCQANGFPLTPGNFPALLAALRSMKDLGYAGFECNIRFVQGEFGRLAGARKLIEDTGVEFISVHMNMSLAKPDTFPSWVQSVAALGGSAIIMSGGGVADAPTTEEKWNQKAATLSELGKTCRDGGLRLCYHNHNSEFADHNAEMNHLAAKTDPALLSFLMDAGHAHLGGGDPAAFMLKHSARIYGCHLKTYKGGQKNQVPLGQGDWGFEDLAAAAQQTSWSGWLLSEEGGSTAAPGTAALGSDREYIRKVFGA